MINIYFISDAHLGFHETPEELEKRERLLSFLEYVSSGAKETPTEIYFLGDLFDFWFEWYHVIPKYWFPVLYQIRKIANSGVKVNFITGNHDFYTGTFLEKEIGMHCFDECREFEINSKRFFVAHGDGLAKKDRGYRLLKRIIRNPISMFLYRTFISPDLGFLFAKWTSGSSRKIVNIDKTSWTEEYYGFAKQKFREGFDYVLLGHIHTPCIRHEGNHTYVNCGDWIREFSYALYNDGTLTLNHWKN
jgi:UDP-2,3-diacylglucosamine hydrolase